MAATIRLPDGSEATLNDEMRWESLKPALAAYLNGVYAWEDQGPADPDPCYTHAAKVAEGMGGVVIASDKPDAREPGEVN